MLLVPLAALPSQVLTTVLGSQICEIEVSQKSTGLFVSLAVNARPIITGVRAFNLNRLVRWAYLGFEGDLVFYDQEGTQDPESSDLGSRYLLYYLTAAEL